MPKSERIHALVEKYDQPGPRYTSYPTVPVWSDAFGPAEWKAAIQRADSRADDPLALYVHLPFCVRRCLFCACNVVITSREDVVEEYLDRLFLEIDRAAELLPNRRKLGGVHWGGGTPTHLNEEQLERLWNKINQHWNLEENAEVSIEVHPPVTTKSQMETLARLGFNRVSFGVQDLDGEVQQLIGRDQTVAQTEQILTWCRELGFESCNFDLIYGLPGQTAETWDYTLSEVLRLRPDRLAVYSYAHVPWLHPHQERMPMDRIPEPETKLGLLLEASRRLMQEGGYQDIGFDHFALPNDEMAKAVSERRLYRSFMGYTVKPAPDYLGFGVTAISEIGGCFAQNLGKLNRWSDAIDQNIPPVARGLQLTESDKIRKLVIERLMCNQFLDYKEVEAIGGQPFAELFPEAIAALQDFEADGLVECQPDSLTVTREGQLFLRNIGMLFDEYLPKENAKGRFSQTV